MKTSAFGQEKGWYVTINYSIIHPPQQRLVILIVCWLSAASPHKIAIKRDMCRYGVDYGPSPIRMGWLKRK